MAWLKIESSVARNQKFLKAGPAAAWLWLCGIAYCQEGLTDGFIPREALPTLGVLKDSDRLATKLVLAGLWDACDEGGWRVHDYLEHNKSAHEVAELKAKKKDAGGMGGRPGKNHRANLTGNLVLSDVQSTVVDVDDLRAVAVLQELEKASFRGDEALRQLQAAYPANRVTSGYRTESAFIDAVEGSVATFYTMLANLDNHKKSHEWRVKGYIPALEKWLRDGLWKRQMEEVAPVGEQLSAKTNRTLAAGAEVLGRRPT